MVDEDLAAQLARTHVRKGHSILDPFCGSGRLLAAAEAMSADRIVGIDINPLAVLLTRARLANPNVSVLRRLLAEIETDTCYRKRIAASSEVKTVQWFNEQSMEELSQIVAWLNMKQLTQPDLLVLGAILSATTRDASFARKSGWKLHRMSEASRSTFAASAWAHFARRLEYFISQSDTKPYNSKNTSIRIGDARRLRVDEGGRKFDVILTSPPYGDSKTTVQYGAASKLCLTFVPLVKGLETFSCSSSVDSQCLGGRLSREIRHLSRQYWAGSAEGTTAKKVESFLADYAIACRGIASSLKASGTAVLIVGQRSTGGFRVKLDQFTIDQFASLGFELTRYDVRKLTRKRHPSHVNRFARSSCTSKRDSGLIRTMSEEFILTFSRSG
ncbi:MAG: hypothetical protein EKK38_12660 [Hyphomicrobium sp.]|nr:MAG: hypothetical protein EKK38_12660 [Hyphomicrobium sp.]